MEEQIASIGFRHKSLTNYRLAHTTETQVTVSIQEDRVSPCKLVSGVAVIKLTEYSMHGASVGDDLQGSRTPETMSHRVYRRLIRK